jgi:hypothetical protein
VEAPRRASKRPRVRVKDRQLRHWYGMLDQLVQKKQIEKELFLRLRTLFSLKVDLVFYDLTPTYFEGNGPQGVALHGYSPDGKPRNRQVLVSLVMIDGRSIAHHVFAGNRRDCTTVESVLKDIQERFGLQRVVFVGDWGIVTSDNMDLLRTLGQGYLVGRNRRRQPEFCAMWNAPRDPGRNARRESPRARSPWYPRPGYRKLPPTNQGGESSWCTARNAWITNAANAKRPWRECVGN